LILVLIAFGCGDAPLQHTAPPLSDAAPPPPAAVVLAPATWIHPYVGDVQIDGMASDASGAIYAGGYFVGRMMLDEQRSLTSIADSEGRPTKDIFVTKHRPDTGAIEWARHFGGAGLEGNAYDLVASDGEHGRLVVASGAFSGSVDFDEIRLTSAIESGSGSGSSGVYGNMFLAALEPTSGKTQWAIQASGDKVVSGGNEIAIAPDGYVVQVGMFGGTAAGGSMRLGATELGFDGGRFDTYVAKVRLKDGGVEWVRHIGGSGGQRGKAIAADEQGNIVVAGDSASGETRFGAAAFESNASSDQDFWIAKYNPRGELLWWKSYASAGYDEVKGIGVERGTGTIVVAAAFGGRSLNLGGDVIVRNDVSIKAGMGVVFGLAPDGQSVRWSNTIGSVVKCCELEVDPTSGHTFLGNAAINQDLTARVALLTELDQTGTKRNSWTVDAVGAEFGELTLPTAHSVAVAGSFEGNRLSFDTNHTVTVSPSTPKARTQFVLSIAR